MPHAPSPNNHTEPIISVRNLTVGYGGEPIFENVSFDVKRGEVLAILGRSGCGKSTLFKAMAGLLAPYSGDVHIEGRRVTPLASGESTDFIRNIGVLFQSGALFSSMTLAENVSVPLAQHTDLSKETIERVVALKLAEVGLTGFEWALPAEVSGGMRKRAALARATAVDPKILFFDEPSAGLDPVTSASLDDLIIRINRNLKTTMVIVTHELASILAVAGVVILLDKEERNIIARGDPRELMKHSDDPRVRAFFHRTSSDGSEEEGGDVASGDDSPSPADDPVHRGP